jgi:hypothetical protein
MNQPDDALIREILSLRAFSVTELRARYLSVFGEETTSRNKDYLFKRIAYRMQEQKYGGLSRAAEARAELLAGQAPIRRRPPREKPPEVATPAPVVFAVVRDPRLPPPGTIMRRVFRGEEHVVTVLVEGFEYRGDHHKSLSALATTIAGSRWNGFTFFSLRDGPST